MNTNDLPEPICHKCLEPVYDEPLYDNAVVGLCPKCFEDWAEEPIQAMIREAKSKPPIYHNTVPRKR